MLLIYNSESSLNGSNCSVRFRVIGTHKVFKKQIFASAVLSLFLANVSWAQPPRGQNNIRLQSQAVPSPTTAPPKNSQPPKAVPSTTPRPSSQPSTIPKSTQPPSQPLTDKTKAKPKYEDQKKKAQEEFPWKRGGIILLLGTGMYGLVRWKKPLWLLCPWFPWLPSECSIPKCGPFPGVKIPIGIILKLRYPNCSLDAWIEERIEGAKEQFERRKTIKLRSNYVPLPVRLDSNLLLDEVSTEQLRSIFEESRSEIRLLIWGEGGIGKTSLACQIAKRVMVKEPDQGLSQFRMIPIFIEDELENSETLMSRIARQVKNLCQDMHPPSDELLKQLLLKRRLLVIVDHLSEMNKHTLEKVRLRDPKSPVNALLVTSRTEDIFGMGETVIKLQPQRIESGRLLTFMDAYLSGKRDLIDDEEYLDNFSRLSQIAVDKRDVTVLFATIFMKQMVAKVEGRLVEKQLADNVPDLLLSYLRELNHNITEDRLTNDDLEQVASIVAWGCLKDTFQPRPASRQTVLETLKNQVSGEQPDMLAKQQLDYLENRLSLIRTTGGSIQFELDPLAEYLASWWIVNDHADNSDTWQKTLVKLKSSSNPENIRGFLLALRECCLVERNKTIVPSFIPNSLAILADLDLEVLKHEQLKRRVRRLGDELNVPEEEDRLSAIDKLAELAFDSKEAILVLVKALDNSSVDVKKKAVITLGSLDWDFQQVVQGLLHCLKCEDQSIRAQSAKALGNLGESSDLVIQGLLDVLKDMAVDISVRSEAVIALGNLGDSSESVIQGLLDALNNQGIKVQAIKALGNLGDSSESVIQGLLDALNDKNDQDVRAETAMALRNLGHNSELVILGLFQAVNNDVDRSVKAYSVGTLNILGKNNEFVITGLLHVLKEHDDPFTRIQAASALGELGKNNELVVEGLLYALTKDHDHEVRQFTVLALGRLGDSCESVIQGLLYALNDKDEEGTVRADAAKVLGYLAKKNDFVIQRLLDSLKSDEVEVVRQYSARALGDLRDNRESVIQGLLNALDRDEGRFVRAEAATALRNLGDSCESVIQGLLDALEDEDQYVKGYSAKALGNLEDSRKSVINALLDMLKSDEVEVVRQYSAEALGNLGDSSKSVINGLLYALNNDVNRLVRAEVATALGNQGNSNESVTQGLLDALKNEEDKYVRALSAEALGHLGESIELVIQSRLDAFKNKIWSHSNCPPTELGSLGEDCINILLKAIQNDRYRIRMGAAQMLGQISFYSEDIEKSLITASDERNFNVRMAAEKALKNIQTLRCPFNSS